MAQSLEEYVAQTTKAYQPAYDSIQSQLNALSGKLETANQAINKNYEQQQDTLNRNRNAAAEAASMQAAGSGGSFGGMANIANRKYYDQTFVPAQTQLQTNQINELAQARQNNENERQSLNSQLASLQAQANQQAMQQYWAEVEAERQRQFQAEQAEKERQAQAAAAAASNSAQNAYYQYLMDAMKSGNNNTSYTLSPFKNKYGGFDWTDSNGTPHTAATVASAAGGDFNNALYSVLQQAEAQGDSYSRSVRLQIKHGMRFEKNTGAKTGNKVYDTLGIKRIY